MNGYVSTLQLKFQFYLKGQLIFNSESLTENYFLFYRKQTYKDCRTDFQISRYTSFELFSLVYNEVTVSFHFFFFPFFVFDFVKCKITLMKMIVVNNEGNSALENCAVQTYYIHIYICVCVYILYNILCDILYKNIYIHTYIYVS